MDITDFSILASNFNVPIEPTLSTGADATANGTQGLDDFTVLQVNFLAVGDATDACPIFAGEPDNRRVRVIGFDDASAATVALPLTEIAVDHLPITRAWKADLDGDGVVDAGDIRAFAHRHNLRLLPEFDRTLARLESRKAGRRHR